MRGFLSPLVNLEKHRLNRSPDAVLYAVYKMKMTDHFDWIEKKNIRKTRKSMRIIRKERAKK